MMASSGKAIPKMTSALFMAALLIGCGNPNQPGEATDADGTTSRSDSTTKKQNTPPEIRSLELVPTHPSSGALVRTKLQAVDADGDPLQYTYEWTLNGSNLGESDAEVVLEGASRGDQLQVIVRVHDGVVEVRKKATLVVSNSSPTLGEVELARTGNHELVAQPRGQDLDGDSLRYRYRWRVNGETLEHADASLPLGEFQMGDEIQAEVVASDEEDQSAIARSIVYTLGNTPPRITSDPASMESTDGSSIRYSIRAQDPDPGHRLRFRLEEGPEGMALDPHEGELTWAPTFEQLGEFSVRIAVEDLQGGVTRQTFTVRAGDE